MARSLSPKTNFNPTAGKRISPTNFAPSGYLPQQKIRPIQFSHILRRAER